MAVPVGRGRGDADRFQRGSCRHTLKTWGCRPLDPKPTSPRLEVSQPHILRPSCGMHELNYFASVVVVELRTTPVYGFAHVVKYKDRDGRHALPLFGTKCFIEWLPRIGELIHIGRSLRQCFRSSLQEGDGVTIAQDFDRVLVGPSAYCFRDFCNTGFPILRPGANSVLDGRPVFFLVRCQLQRGLCQINPQIHQGIPVRCI